MRLILASASPRRRELLSRLGVPFDVITSEVAEREPAEGESPEEYTLALAREKALAISSSNPRCAVLAADTTVTVDGEILGKPRDAADAEAMLRRLSGRRHTVATSVAVACCGRLHAGTASATVHMRAFSDAEAAWYVATGEPMDKAGAYAVQGLGGQLVTEVIGCYLAVVGLPLCLTKELLRLCPDFAELNATECVHLGTR